MRYGVCMLAPELRGRDGADVHARPPHPRIGRELESLLLAEHVSLLQKCRADKLAPGDFDILGVKIPSA